MWLGNIAIGYEAGVVFIRTSDAVVAVIPAGRDVAKVHVNSSVDVPPSFGVDWPVPLVRTGPGGDYTQDWPAESRIPNRELRVEESENPNPNSEIKESASVSLAG